MLKFHDWNLLFFNACFLYSVAVFYLICSTILFLAMSLFVYLSKIYLSISFFGCDLLPHIFLHNSVLTAHCFILDAIFHFSTSVFSLLHLFISILFNYWDGIYSALQGQSLKSSLL
ncbi:hypothetical protein V8B55DRAFT_1166149 [Mucor lusitanicus]